MAASPHRVPNIPLFEFFCKKFFDISEIKDKGGVHDKCLINGYSSSPSASRRIVLAYRLQPAWILGLCNLVQPSATFL
jgi:hypothetical protein